jgi:hypothetical protein
MIEEVIMINCSRWMMAVGIAGLVTASYGEPFTLKEANHQLMLERGVLEWDMASSPLQSLRPQMKAPEGAIDPKVKIYYSGRGELLSLLFFKSSKEATMFDRVVLDENGNKDFTDDPVLILDSERPLDVKWKVKGREATDYRIYPIKSKGGNLENIAFLPKLWREGTVTLEDKPVRAVIQNNHMMEKTLLIDRDGDGKFNFNSREDQFQISAYMKIKDAFYKASVGASEDEFSLDPFNGPFGKLEVAGELVLAGSQGTVDLVLMGTEAGKNKNLPNFFYVKTALTNQPILIPAGEYTIRGGRIADTGEQGKSIGFRMDKKIVLSPEQVTKIVLDQPKAELAITQNGRKLTVNRKVVSANDQGITYSLGRDKEPLVVDVVDSSDPAKVLIGRKNMEYG